MKKKYILPIAILIILLIVGLYFGGFLAQFIPTERSETLDFCSTESACISHFKSYGLTDSDIAKLDIRCKNNVCKLYGVKEYETT